MQSSLSNNFLCGTLSKALEKSRNSTCELDRLSRVLAHSCTISNNCVWYECLLLKLCWDGLSLLCSLRKFMIFRCTKRSIIFTKMLVRLMGLYIVLVVCLLPFLYTGVTLTHVQSDGNCPDWSDWLKKVTNGSESQGAPSLNSLPGIQSGPQALEA